MGLAVGLMVILAGVVGIFLMTRLGTAVPILMYHHFISEGPAEADTVVSAQRFEEQMRALRDGGYTAITPQELLDYEDGVGQLPDHPVWITMDDGYSSNLEIAAPILERYGMKATIFTIGINVGETEYPHSGEKLDPPRFSWEEARPWVEKGVICVQSHTYDMHQRADYGFSGRDGVLPMPGENDSDYRKALRDDFTKARDGLRDGLGVRMDALAFPFGLCSQEAVEELSDLDTRVTLSTAVGCRRVVPGWERSLQCMQRMWINDQVTGDQLLTLLHTRVAKARINLF